MPQSCRSGPTYTERTARLPFVGSDAGSRRFGQRRRASTLPKSHAHLASLVIKVYGLAFPWTSSEDFMETRNVAVCDKFGNRLKTYPITLEKREDGSRNDEFAVAALE